MKNKVQLKIEKYPIRLQPYIDGEELPFCSEINPCKSDPETIKFQPYKDIIFEKEVNIDCTEYVNIAIIILKNELSKHTELYNGFQTSIESAINEAPNYTNNKKLSNLILKRIIGEE